MKLKHKKNNVPMVVRIGPVGKKQYKGISYKIEELLFGRTGGTRQYP